MQPHLEKYNYVGTPGMFLLDINSITSILRACYWKGYNPKVRNESIGLGRLLSADLLNKLHWRPFNDVLNNSLDGSMTYNSAKHGIRDNMVRDERLKSLSISTDIWSNKHSFEDHWSISGRLSSDSEKISDVKQFLDFNFPEAFQLYENIASVRV